MSCIHKDVELAREGSVTNVDKHSVFLTDGQNAHNFG